MNEQALIQFRADRELKEETTKIFASLGFDMSTALRMFLVKARQVRGLPFEAVLNEHNLNLTVSDKMIDSKEDNINSKD